MRISSKTLPELKQDVQGTAPCDSTGSQRRILHQRFRSISVRLVHADEGLGEEKAPRTIRPPRWPCAISHGTQRSTAVPYGQPDQQVRPHDRLILGSLQAGGPSSSLLDCLGRGRRRAAIEEDEGGLG